METTASATPRGLTPATPRARVRVLTSWLPTPVRLGMLVAVITALNVWWRTTETRPPHWDMGHHLSNSLRYLDGFSLADPRWFLDAYLFYPPLVYWAADVFYAVVGSDAMWVATLSNAVWLAVLVFATFGVGKRLWNARVGWLSVVFVVTAPMIVGSSKEFMLDLPITAIAALALYLLVRAEGFASRRYSLLLGAACGAGLLVKWTLPLVVALPLLHAAATALAEARQGRFGRMRNLAGAAAFTFAIAGTWYMHNFSQVAGSLKYYSGAEGVRLGNPPVASLGSALWYLWNALNTQLYLVPFVFVLVGVVFCFRSRELASRNLYPILMAAGTYLTFTLLRHKDPRYTLPMLPGLAIVATSWLGFLARRARMWAATVLVAYGAAALLAISFGTSLLPKSVAVGLPSTSFIPTEAILFAQHAYLIGPPTDENWHQTDLFEVMAKVPRSQRSFRYHGPDTIWFNAHGLNYYRLRNDARWAVGRNARFLIERGATLATPRGYSWIKQWPLPDGGTLALYERV